MISLAKKYFIRPVSVIEGRGSEVIDFLNRIGTNELRTLKPGQTTGTIFLNDRGRIIGFVKIISNFEKILIITEKEQEKTIYEHLGKYIFSDDVKFSLSDDQFTEIVVFYKDMDDYVEFRNSIIRDYNDRKNLHYHTVNIYGSTFNILVKKTESEIIKRYLNEYTYTKGEIPEFYRIMNKIPKYPNEINESTNPLECGLEKFVSLDKGCYTGQEVLARIDSRNKLPKSLRVFRSTADTEEKSPIYFTNKGKETEAGTISSVTEYNNEFYCLGFIRTIYFSDENEYYTIKKEEKNKLILIN